MSIIINFILNEPPRALAGFPAQLVRVAVAVNAISFCIRRIRLLQLGLGLLEGIAVGVLTQNESVPGIVRFEAHGEQQRLAP